LFPESSLPSSLTGDKECLLRETIAQEPAREPYSPLGDMDGP
jgi:hypothetical protein